MKSLDEMLHNPFQDVIKDEERAVKFERILDDVKDLSGKILTIIDASVVDPKQNKAIKDLIKTDINKFLGWYENICYFGKRGSCGQFVNE